MKINKSSAKINTVIFAPEHNVQNKPHIPQLHIYLNPTYTSTPHIPQPHPSELETKSK